MTPATLHEGLVAHLHEFIRTHEQAKRQLQHQSSVGIVAIVFLYLGFIGHVDIENIKLFQAILFIFSTVLLLVWLLVERTMRWLSHQLIANRTRELAFSEEHKIIENYDYLRSFLSSPEEYISTNERSKIVRAVVNWTYVRSADTRWIVAINLLLFASVAAWISGVLMLF